MATILNIETSTKNCSVSLAQNGKVLSMREVNEGRFSHAEKLHPFIVTVLKEAQIPFEKLDAIAVSKGPGSYTGLRIGVSAAKGLCYALDKPLISVDTLKVLAKAVAAKPGEFIAPMIDARRMEVYTKIFDSSLFEQLPTQALIVEETGIFSNFLAKNKVHFLGDGAEKCKPVISHPEAVFHENLFPSAKEMAQLSFEKFSRKDFEDVAYFEPFYLKDFIAGKPKKLF